METVAETQLDLNGFAPEIYAEEMVVDYEDVAPSNAAKNSVPVTIYRLIKREDAEAMGISLEEGSVSTPNENTKVITRQIIKLDKNFPLIKKDDKSVQLKVHVEDAAVENSLDGSFDDSKKDLEEHKFRCKLCPKQFRHLSHLKRHTNVHSGDRPFSCVVCSKCFLDASTLSRHSRTHSGERPHECATCGKAFGASGSLRRHETVHDPAARRFACAECEKRFPDNSSYRKHLLTHDGVRPHRCDACEKSFFHVGDLNGHRKIHELVKPHNCSHCHRQFVKQSNYERHLLIHEGGRRFACHICAVSYNFQSSLTRHLLTHVKRAHTGSNQKLFVLDGNVEGVDTTKLTIRTIRQMLHENQVIVDDERWEEITEQMSETEDENDWGDGGAEEECEEGANVEAGDIDGEEVGVYQLEVGDFQGDEVDEDNGVHEDNEGSEENEASGESGIEQYQVDDNGHYESIAADGSMVYVVQEFSLGRQEGEVIIS